LFVFFSLISLQWWTQYVRTGSAWGQTYWLALLALVAACLSKSAAVMLPLSLLVLDIWWKRPLLKNALEKIPFFAVSLGFGVLTLVSRVHEGHVTALDSVYTPFERFLMACHSVLFYWTKFILPTGLSIWYPFTKTAGGQLPLAYFIAPFLLAGILVFAWWKRKEWPLLWAGILFYLANIILALPFSTMGTFELRSDRYNYLAMLGLIAILCYIPLYLQQKKPALAKPAWGVLGGLMVFWLFATVQRIGEWKDTMILLNKSIERQGDNFGRAYYWRGMEWGDRAKSQKDWQRAIEDFSKALEINPELTECYKYRGALYGITNQFDKSVADLTEYLKVKPNDAEYRYNRGLSLLNLGRPAETVADMTQTLQDNPDFYQAYLTRSNAYQMLGDAAKAQQDMEAYQRMAQMAGGK
jgi:tetratricopeptide (TPR) repeat protein